MTPLVKCAGKDCAAKETCIRWQPIPTDSQRFGSWDQDPQHSAVLCDGYFHMEQPMNPQPKQFRNPDVDTGQLGQTARSSEVENAIGIVYNRLETLDQRLSTLNQRLESVLSVAPAVTDPRKDADPDFYSPLGNQIGSISKSITSRIHHVEAMINALAI